MVYFADQRPSEASSFNLYMQRYTKQKQRRGNSTQESASHPPDEREKHNKEYL